MTTWFFFANSQANNNKMRELLCFGTRTDNMTVAGYAAFNMYHSNHSLEKCAFIANRFFAWRSHISIIEKTTRAKQHGWSWMCILVEVTWTCNPSLKWTWKSSLLPFHGWPEMITAKAGHCCIDVFGPWYNLCLMWQAGVKRGKRWCSIKTCRYHWEQSYTVCCDVCLGLVGMVACALQIWNIFWRQKRYRD